MKKNGFTIVEVLVAIAVLTIILTIFISRKSFFEERFNIEEQAQDFAAAVRRAQVETIGAKEFKCVADGFRTFDASYGVSISYETDSHFTYFMDKNGDGIFNDTSNSCYFEEKVFNTPDILLRICAEKDVTNTKRCYPEPSPANNLRKVDITFRRPDSKPIIKFTNLSGDITSPAMTPPAYAYFKYPGGTDEIEVKVESTGQVSVKLVAP